MIVKDIFTALLQCSYYIVTEWVNYSILFI